jgi:hypothetical protein
MTQAISHIGIDASELPSFGAVSGSLHTGRELRFGPFSVRYEHGEVRISLRGNVRCIIQPRSGQCAMFEIHGPTDLLPEIVDAGHAARATDGSLPLVILGQGDNERTIQAK